MAYVLPQVQVFQIFSQLPTEVVKNLNAFVFGPHYRLFRYDYADERSSPIDYNNSLITTAWADINANHPAGGDVDTDYVKVIMDNAWLRYSTLSGTVDVNDTNVIKFSGATNELSRVAVGDPVKVGSVNTVVNGFRSTPVPAVTGAIAADGDNVTTGTGNLSNNILPVACTSGGTLDSVAVGIVAGWTFDGLVAVGTGAMTLNVTVNADTLDVTYVEAKQAWRVPRVPLSAGDTPSGFNGLGAHLGYSLFFFEINTGAVTGCTYTFEVIPAAVTVTANTFNYSGDFIRDIDGVFSIEVVKGGYLKPTLIKDTYRHFGIADSGGILDYVHVSDDVYNRGENLNYAIVCTTVGNDYTLGKYSIIDITGAGGIKTNQNLINGVNVIADGITLDLTNVVDASGGLIVGDWVTIHIKAAKPSIAVYDSRGRDGTAARIVQANDEIVIGYTGLTLKIADVATTLYKGDVFEFSCTAATQGDIDQVELADSVASGGATVTADFHVISNGIKVPVRNTSGGGLYNWQATKDNVTIYPDITIMNARFPGIALPIVSADAYVEYRALITDYADVIRSVASSSEAIVQLGPAHPDNPLAAGVVKALNNSGNREVYFMAVPSDDLKGWNTVLDRATLNGEVYAFAPLTNDMAVLNSITEHINALSTETDKRWRIGFFSAAMPKSKDIYTDKTSLDGYDYLAKVSADAAGDYKVLTFVNSDGTTNTDITAVKDVKIGDKVRIDFDTNAWGDSVYSEFTVAKVMNNAQLQLASALEYEITVPHKVEVIHNYSVNEAADAYAAISASFYNRRIYNVFPDALYSGGVRYSGVFGAAAVAGLASSVPPQQPITNIALNGFDDIPAVYQTFNRAQLNKMAEFGTLIIMQDLPGSTVYIRHQISTKASAGNLNESELSLIKNFDSISYYFAARFAPYIGRYNISPDFLAIIDAILKDGVSYLGSLTAVGELGPQLIADETEIEGVIQHPIYKDHVVANVLLSLPKPFNVLQLKLMI